MKKAQYLHVAILAFSLCCLFIFIPEVGEAQLSSPSLMLSPSTATAEVGSTFVVNVFLNTAGKQIYGVDINKIHFNTAVLQVVDTDTSKPGTQITTLPIIPIVMVNTVDNTAGTVKFSQLANPGTVYNNSGNLASITFRVVGVGTSNVTIDFTPGSGLDSNIAGTTGDILAVVGNGTYIGIPSTSPTPTPDLTPSTTPVPRDTTPPVISISFPYANANLSGVIDVSAAATDNVGIAGVQFLIDDLALGSEETTAPFTVTTNTALIPNGQHSFSAVARDISGNTTISNKVYTTITNTVSLPPPVISSISVQSTENSAAITFLTNQAAENSLDYGTNSGYSYTLPFTNSFTTTHSRTITGLAPATIYHYRIRAQNAFGGIIETSDGTFITRSITSTPTPNPTPTPTVTSQPLPSHTPILVPYTSQFPLPVVIQGSGATYGGGVTSSSTENFVPVVPTAQRQVYSQSGASNNLFHRIIEGLTGSNRGTSSSSTDESVSNSNFGGEEILNPDGTIYKKPSLLEWLWNNSFGLIYNFVRSAFHVNSN